MSSTTPHVFSPDDLAPFHPSYSHICSTPLLPTARLVTFAGQIGLDSTTRSVPTSFREQVELALANLQKCLDAAGVKKTDIVHVKHFIVNILDRDYNDRVEPYMKFMDGYAPPSTLLGVQALATKDLLYEIEVMAVVQG
jgi:enamine deaminase RidA (YjgF/YER057c/UK114 family)